MLMKCRIWMKPKMEDACAQHLGKKSPQKQINPTYCLSLAWQIKELLLKMETEDVRLSNG